MSADNFNFVRQRDDGRWYVWLNLSASCDTSEQLAAQKPDRDFATEAEAVAWADDQGFTEYGTEIETTSASGGGQIDNACP